MKSYPLRLSFALSIDKRHQCTPALADVPSAAKRVLIVGRYATFVVRRIAAAAARLRARSPRSGRQGNDGTPRRSRAMHALSG